MPQNPITPPDQRIPAIRAAWLARWEDEEMPSTVLHDAQIMMRDTGCTPEFALDYIMEGGVVVQRGRR